MRRLFSSVLFLFCRENIPFSPDCFAYDLIDILRYFRKTWVKLCKHRELHVRAVSHFSMFVLSQEEERCEGTKE